MVAIAVDYRHSMIHILVAIETVGGMDVSDLLKSKINSLTVKSKSAKLKSIMPEIDRKVSEGVSHEAIIAALAEEGFIVSMPTSSNVIEITSMLPFSAEIRRLGLTRSG